MLRSDENRAYGMQFVSPSASRENRIEGLTATLHTAVLGGCSPPPHLTMTCLLPRLLPPAGILPPELGTLARLRELRCHANLLRPATRSLPLQELGGLAALTVGHP